MKSIQVVELLEGKAGAASVTARGTASPPGVRPGYAPTPLGQFPFTARESHQMTRGDCISSCSSKYILVSAPPTWPLESLIESHWCGFASYSQVAKAYFLEILRTN